MVGLTRKKDGIDLVVATAALVAAVAVLGAGAPVAKAESCPNEAIRAEQGAAAMALPDCRAYELVSPDSTPSMTADSLVESGGKAATDGDALEYYSLYPAKGSSSSSLTWRAARTASGWTVEGLEPPGLSLQPNHTFVCFPGVALSEDLGTYLLSAGADLYPEWKTRPEGECGVPAAELVAGEPRGYSNLYLHVGGSPYELLNMPPSGVPAANATYQDSSSDLSRVVFSENAQLTPDSPAGNNLFEWSEGVIRLVGLLPSGEPVNAILGAATKNLAGEYGNTNGTAPVTHAVSSDGERVFFEAAGALYLRENAGHPPASDANCRMSQATEPEGACTLQVDASRGVGPSGGGIFQFASRDGSKVFFTSEHKLTTTSSAESEKPDLYELDVETNQLRDLTAGGAEAADVQGISGGSDDGSYIYFVARGVLTGSEHAANGEVAMPREPNLYLGHAGSLTYVATLSPWLREAHAVQSDRGAWWSHSDGRLRTTWSPSGRYLVFSTRKQLTDFDNSAPVAPSGCEPGGGVPESLCDENCPIEATSGTGGSCSELFLFDAQQDRLTCLSCGPVGTQSLGNTLTPERAEFTRTPGPRYMPRSVFDDGRVFFQTVNPLVPGDTNGSMDVYEYDSGTTSLISSGTAEGGSAFVDASGDGRNVFIVAPDALVPSDTDGLPNVYDARVDGGFAEPPAPPVPCEGESCRQVATGASSTGPSATSGFAGPGNLRPLRCKPGLVRRHGRCVRKPRHRGRRHHGHPPRCRSRSGSGTRASGCRTDRTGSHRRAGRGE